MDINRCEQRWKRTNLKDSWCCLKQMLHRFNNWTVMSKEWQDRANKSCLWTIQTPTNTILTQWNHLMSFVLKIVLKNILKKTHAKTESNPKRKKVNILKTTRTVLANVLLVGQERVLRCHKRASPRTVKTIFKWKQLKIQRKIKQHREKRTKYKQGKTLET